jgi:predicted TIM-barrel fold metal-dependent hydrolase
MDGIGAEKILFGTDAPTFSFMYSENEWIDMVRDLPAKAPGGKIFTEEEIDAVLHGNAARVLGL